MDVMSSRDVAAHSPVTQMPWFRERPRATLAVAAALFVAVFALRMLTGDSGDVINLLYTLPVALVALAFGRPAGVAVGVLAVVLVVVWAVFKDVDLSVLGWVSRVLPLLLLGGLLGDAADRLAAADARQRAHETAAQRHRDAAEVNDTLIQGMAAAKWALESGRHEAALDTLAQTVETGHALVSRLMRDADMGLNGHRPPPHS